MKKLTHHYYTKEKGVDLRNPPPNTPNQPPKSAISIHYLRNLSIPSNISRCTIRIPLIYPYFWAYFETFATIPAIDRVRMRAVPP